MILASYQQKISQNDKPRAMTSCNSKICEALRASFGVEVMILDQQETTCFCTIQRWSAIENHQESCFWRVQKDIHSLDLLKSPGINRKRENHSTPAWWFINSGKISQISFHKFRILKVLWGLDLACGKKKRCYIQAAEEARCSATCACLSHRWGKPTKIHESQ